MTTRSEAIARLTAPGRRFEIVRATVGTHELPVYRNAPVNMREVFETSTAAFAERTFLVYENERYTYEDVRR